MEGFFEVPIQSQSNLVISYCIIEHYLPTAWYQFPKGKDTYMR